MVDEVDGSLWKIPLSSKQDTFAPLKLAGEQAAESWEKNFIDSAKDVTAFVSSELLMRISISYGVHVVFQSTHVESFVYGCNINVKSLRGSTRFVWPISFCNHMQHFDTQSALGNFPPMRKETLLFDSSTVKEFDLVTRQRSPRPCSIKGALPVERDDWRTLLSAEDRQFFLCCITSPFIYRNSLNAMTKYVDLVKTLKERNVLRIKHVENMERFQTICGENMKRAVSHEYNSLHPTARLDLVKRGRDWADAELLRNKLVKHGGSGSNASSIPLKANLPGAERAASELSGDLFFCIVENAVDKIMAESNNKEAAARLCNLALVSRQFRNITNACVERKLVDVNNCIGNFVSSGTLQSKNTVLDEFVGGGSMPHMLPYMSFCLFGCSLVALKDCQPSARGFLERRARSKLSQDVCDIRARIGNERRQSATAAPLACPNPPLRVFELVSMKVGLQ